GAVYGRWWGTLWSVIGATSGAIAAFWLARYLLHDWVKQRFHHRPLLQKLNHTLGQNTLSCVLIVRFSPVSPFNVVNFAFGLLPVPLGTYAVGTLIGIIPGTLAYTWLGVTGAEALSGESLLPLFGCLMGLMLLSALPVFIRHRKSLRKRCD
ncbi:MAG: TVP38/TMEM64 family protein, partial [Phormidesmis sp.]